MSSVVYTKISGSKDPPFNGLAMLAAELSNAPELQSTLSLGENGAAEHALDKLTKLEDMFVAINSINHGDGFETKIHPVLKNLSSGLRSQPRNVMETGMDFYIRLIAHKRDCRKKGMGNGSRDVPLYMWTVMYQEMPEMRTRLVNFLDQWYLHYGCVRDCKQLWYNTCFYNIKEGKECYGKWTGLFNSDTKKHIQSIVVDWFVKMFRKLQKDGPASEYLIASKWFPQESRVKGKDGHKHSGPYTKLARAIAYKIFSPHVENRPAAYKAFRKALQPFRNNVRMPETDMCAKKFDKIEHNNVPGKCSSKHRQAFLFQNKTMQEKTHMSEKDPDYYTSRIKCSNKREAFLEKVKSGETTAKGTSLFMTEIANKLTQASCTNSDKILYEGMFQDQINELRRFADENGIDMDKFFSNMLCLLDTSASMEGPPMDLVYAIGCLIPPLSNGPFKGNYISFDTNPVFVQLMVDGENTSFSRMLEVMTRGPWGGNTNFVAVFSLILNKVKKLVDEGNLTHEEACQLFPSIMCIISDMQMDKANVHSKTDDSGEGFDSWAPIHDHIVSMFRIAGEKQFGKGKGYVPPLFLYWNARDNTKGIPVVAKTKGALMVSGYSSAIVKTFITAGIEGLEKYTPWSYLKKTVMNSWYDRAVAGPLF